MARDRIILIVCLLAIRDCPALSPTPTPPTIGPPPVPTHTPVKTTAGNGIDVNCVDKVECSSFGDYACKGDYIPWAKNNCPQYCGFCQGPTTPEPPCEDSPGVDCKVFGPGVCTDPDYMGWAEGNCRRSCGFCVYTGPTTTPITTQPATIPFKECMDKVDCVTFGDYVCKGDYIPWAQTNCPAYCKFCQGPTTQPPPCEDAIDDCNIHNPSVCTDPNYVRWAQDKCRRWCGFCEYTGPTTPPPTSPPTTTIAPKDCVDLLPNCESFGDYSCKGDYVGWAKKNCLKTCGFCKGIPEPPKPCVDAKPNCDAYNKDLCTNDAYKGWAKDNCRKYCDLCGDSTTTTINSIATPPTPVHDTTTSDIMTPPIITTTTTAMCMYKGNMYKKGQVWDDGCATICRCNEPASNDYHCKDRCPKWDLGPECKYIKEPGQCCPKVRCNSDDGTLVGK